MQCRGREGDVPLLKVGDLSNRYNVSYRALRYYEELGLLMPVWVGAQRRYSARDETRLQLIIMGKKLGFTLQGIAELIGDYVKRRQADPTEICAVLDIATVERQLVALEEQRRVVDKMLLELRSVAGTRVAADLARC